MLPYGNSLEYKSYLSFSMKSFYYNSSRKIYQEALRLSKQKMMVV